MKLARYLALTLLLSAPAWAGDPVCFRGDVFKALGSTGQAPATSSCGRIDNTGGKSQYTSWACGFSGNRGISTWFQLPTRFHGQVSLVRTWWRSPVVMSGPTSFGGNGNGVCWSISGTTVIPSGLGGNDGVAFENVRGYTDVVGQNAAGTDANGSQPGTFSHPIPPGITTIQESAGTTQGFNFANPVTNAPCAGTECDEQPTLLAVFRSPICAATLISANVELLMLCIYP